MRTDLLTPSETHTVCAYKGVASYFDVQVGTRLERDLVWTYRAPLTDALAVEELFCFFDERVGHRHRWSPERPPAHPLEQAAGAACSRRPQACSAEALVGGSASSSPWPSVLNRSNEACTSASASVRPTHSAPSTDLPGSRSL